MNVTLLQLINYMPICVILLCCYTGWRNLNSRFFVLTIMAFELVDMFFSPFLLKKGEIYLQYSFFLNLLMGFFIYKRIRVFSYLSDKYSYFKDITFYGQEGLIAIIFFVSSLVPMITIIEQQLYYHHL